MKKLLYVSTIVFLGAAGTGCGGGGGGGGGNSDPTFPVATCTMTVDDSIQNPDGTANRIRSESSGTYKSVTLTRRTSANGSIDQDYMMHEPPGSASGFLVLIAGGQMDAGITGTNNVMPATNANGNFLIRSAHLLAAQGFRVMTIDRPSDYADYLGGNFVSGYAYDGYRVSPEHAVDLSELINIENTGNLPVIIVGTSRGSISAVKQHKLGAAIAISGPLTGGNNGFPVTSSDAAQVSEPTHVLWHNQDGCSVTTPSAAASLVGDFPDATGKAVDGGFNDINQTNPCKANTFHGFMGIESCAVTFTTDWIDGELMSLPATRPTASTVVDSTQASVAKDIDLTSAATATAAGVLTYSLPHATTSLGGSVTISGNTVTYTPTGIPSGTTDTFVYVVNEAGGGTSHNVVSVSITP